MPGPHATGVRVSADSARVVRWSPELTVRHRIDSTVPGRHRSTRWPSPGRRATRVSGPGTGDPVPTRGPGARADVTGAAQAVVRSAR
jgi:hypothetical protein